MENAKKSKKVTRRRVLAAGLGLGVLGAVDMFLIEPAWLETTFIQVPIKGLPKAFEGYRIGHMTDVHWPMNIDQTFVTWAMESIMELEPDIVCFTGDVFEGRYQRQVHDLTGVFDLLGGAPDGGFIVRGNHDYRLQNEKKHTDPLVSLREIERSIPLEVLENRFKIIEKDGDRLAFAGIEDMWYGEPDVWKALEGIPDDVCRILLSHNPDMAEELPSELRVDLQLSGHTHGGHYATPFRWAPKTNSKYGQKFLRGLCEGKSHRVYVCRGLARGNKHARLFSRPEVAVIELVTG